MHCTGALFADIATVPQAKTDFHGGLRELCARLGCGECADDFSIDGPDDLGRRPVNCVSMECRLRRCNADVFGDPVVQDAFAIIIGLGLSSVGASELPVDFVQVVGEQNHATYYALTWSDLGNIFDASEKEEEVGVDGWRIALFPKIEHGAHSRTESGVLVESAGPVAREGSLLGEIHEVRAGRKTQPIGADDYIIH